MHLFSFRKLFVTCSLTGQCQLVVVDESVEHVVATVLRRHEVQHLPAEQTDLEKMERRGGKERRRGRERKEEGGGRREEEEGRRREEEEGRRREEKEGRKRGVEGKEGGVRGEEIGGGSRGNRKEK